MARQEGIVLLRGRVGNLSFYKMNGKYFVRRKSGVSGERIKSEAVYARTRENIAEFGRASLSAKLFRRAFGPSIRSMSDTRITGRLTAAMLRVLKSDAVNSRGERRASNGDSALLKDFEFNKHCKLGQRFLAPYTASIDRATGVMNIDIPAFTPTVLISPPPGATHFRLRTSGAAIDFDGDRYTVTTAETAEIPITDTPQHPLKLSMSVSASSSHPMFLVLGIEFLQSVNGNFSPLSETSNAMAIVNVNDNPVHDTLPNVERVAITRQITAPAKRPMTGRKPVRFNRKRISDPEHKAAAERIRAPFVETRPALSRPPGGLPSLCPSLRTADCGKG
jgi:hypothetical protein